MRLPPRLTTRELDCLPLLVSGKTRHEMADLLGVSAETIKKHVRSLLSKYDAANLRDALPTMRLDWDYYHSGQFSFDVFCKSAEFAVTVDCPNATMQVTVTQKFVVIGSQVSRLKFSVISDNFPMTDVKIDGRVPTQLPGQVGRMVFESPIVPPAAPGSQFTRSSVVTYKMPHSRSNGYYAGLCSYPTEFLTMNVTFKPAPRPDQMDAAVYLFGLKVQDEPVEVKQTVQGLQMTSFDPGFQKSYVINWEW